MLADLEVTSAHSRPDRAQGSKVIDTIVNPWLGFVRILT